MRSSSLLEGCLQMKLVSNTGNDRVIDHFREALKEASQMDLASADLSAFAFHEALRDGKNIRKVRLLLPFESADLALLGTSADRHYRNTLKTRWISRCFKDWIQERTEVRRAKGGVPQGIIVFRDPNGRAQKVIMGSVSFSTHGLGLAPMNPLSLIQVSEGEQEAVALSEWFETQWNVLSAGENQKNILLEQFGLVSSIQSTRVVYARVLNAIFGHGSDEIDEDKIIKAATGIRDSAVWKKLYRFQRDAVIGAIDKLDKYGGCIIADSVGLGKTFEAIAVIKYHELRNDRVLVLCPKRLRDNWTLYKINDRRNSLAADRLNYDVLNHTDLSRDTGLSGDIDLSHINWGNYDLVVIDESHNFRNKQTPKKGGETRYDRLMRRIIQEGVRTKVLMLSATPVNNRMADLRNQISFATEANDKALLAYGISSIESTTRRAQLQFNRWLSLDEQERTPTQLIEMLGFDYFKLLDLLTIARSRKHIEKYYGTAETGKFPARLKPINIKCDVDVHGQFRSIREINQEIRHLNLAVYAPLRYVFPHKQEVYEKKYGTEIRGGTGFFKQVDREENLIHLLRVNILKRMESSVSSFLSTVERQLWDVDGTLARISGQAKDFEEVDIENIDVDDPVFETLLVGSKVKVLLQDVDLVRWKQDLKEDRSRLAALAAAARKIDISRDAKLSALRQMISDKCKNPINAGNKKILVFSAFADTARYLYQEISGWAITELGIKTALVTGSGGNQTTLTTCGKDLSSILTAFSPRSKERPPEFSNEGEIDLLIATDCISEGQNLQDCDWLINYDIHWNPVRIIQRFGRIDRIGSKNQQIQLVNFWPNMELEEYINLEQRVSGRMVLLDISATGEENLIEEQSGNKMNDL
jgi:hypothetical protein